MKVYQRTENGTTTYVSVQDGMAEINNAMMAGKRNVREMSSLNATDYAIQYKDGRSVRLVRTDAPTETKAPESANGRQIVTVKGERYVVGTIVPARPKTEGVATWVPQPYVNYWAGGPLGIPSGPTRLAKASMRPGTVGRAIWDAVSAS